VPDLSLRSLLRGHHAALRRAVIARHALRAAAAGATLIAAAVLAGAALPLGPGLATARLVALAIAGLAVLAWAAIAVAARSPRFDRYLEQVEERFPAVRSWLRNALDLEGHSPVGTSEELAAALRAGTASRLATVPVATLAPRIAPGRPTGAIALAAAAVLVAAAVFPARVQRSWASLANPAAAAPPIRLVVEPGSVEVSPGATLAVRARVWGTNRPPALLRDGERAIAAVEEGVDPGGERRWRLDLPPLTREQQYRVRVASVESPRYTIAMAGDPSPLSFEVEYHAPAYARLPVQRGSSTSGDLAALRGTRARVEVAFDRDLESLDAAFPGGVAAAFQPVSPRRWRGEVTIGAAGTWQLHARAAQGEGRFRYRVTPLADAPPVIAVRTPEGDLDLPHGQRVPLEVVGQDDLGLSELELEVRTDAAAAWTRVPLARFPQAPREADVASAWDAAGLGLLPGQTASFRFVLWDNNALGRGRAVSPVFELRFPSLADLYESIDRDQHRVQSALEKVADRAEELQKSLDRLARQQPQPQRLSMAAPSPTSQAFERTEELKQALERQRELARQLDDAARELRDTAERAAERRAFDEQLMRKLRELSELVQQIQSPEFRRALERMQQALQNLDRRQMEQNLSEWRDRNRELMQQLERSIELLKRLREEERLASLADRAEELKRRQDALNQEHAPDSERDTKGTKSAKEQAESREAQSREESESRDARDARENAARDAEAKALAERQERAAEETERLAAETRETAEQLSSDAERAEMDEAARELSEQAAPEQREAAGEAQQGQRSSAGKSGREASASLQRAAQRMRQLAQQRQQERESVDLAAVRRAARDLVSLQRAAEQNLESGESPKRRADRATDLSEGVARVADSLSTLSQRTPFLSQDLGAALGHAMENLRESGRGMTAGNRQRAEEAGRAGAEALNQAILELRQGEQSMCQQPGQGGGQTPSRGQQMGEMGERQSQLNQKTRSLARRLSEQMELGAGDEAELRRLSEEQARIRQQVEQMAREEEGERRLLGRLDQMQREMKEVEEQLARGNASGDLEEKQVRILSRMLDAQRSINRRDFDPERESRAGEVVPQRSPGEIPADLLRSTDRLRLDLLKAEADRYPAQYRAFIESYLRALNEARR
jgi:hypothetical protein